MSKSLQQKWQDLVASKDGPGGSSASSERLVALTLSLHMKPDGSAFPGQLLLMERTALCERTVRVALDTLDRDEWIIRKKPGRNYIYQARIPERLTPATAAGIDDRIPATAAAVENPTPATDSTTPATGSKNTGNDCRLTDHKQTKNRERGSHGAALPSDFVITPEMRDWAKKEVDPSIDIDHATKKFCNHHQATGSTRPDWQAAWRKWMLDERSPQANGNAGGWPDVQVLLREIHRDKPDYAETILNTCKDQFGIQPCHVLAAIRSGATSKMEVLAAAGKEAGIQ